MRSVGPGDMKSLIVEEISILWSAIGLSEITRERNGGRFADHDTKQLVYSFRYRTPSIPKA